MRLEKRRRRKAEIEAAAYQLFEENGYAGTSMLAIAKQAKASNETLYRWYGDKLGLFRSMIESNARQVSQQLEAEISAGQSPIEIINLLGPNLLKLLLGERAIALNRIAAANSNEGLGTALAQAGRESVVPKVAAVFEAAQNQGHFANVPLPKLVETYIALLVGDLQIRRVTGAIPPLSDKDISHRCREALSILYVVAGNQISQTD